MLKVSTVGLCFILIHLLPEFNGLPTDGIGPFSGKNLVHRLMMDQHGPIVIREPLVDYETLYDAGFLRELRNKEKLLVNNDDTKDRYNRKDNSMYKDAFIGVRG
ncbi:uncharacterized protein LOC141856333 [Brevipalpus obovatus]|uniref:uncharacterized protein LOC141856333 n=1 Tax=Brevipalpus obovatus TaxID=246614 RepID=UPI003D9F869C